MRLVSKNAGLVPKAGGFWSGKPPIWSGIAVPAVPCSRGAAINIGPWQRGILHCRTKTPGKFQYGRQETPLLQSLPGGLPYLSH
jgi:hypothetical protein